MTAPFKFNIQPSVLDDLAQKYGTPLWVYDAATIENRIAQLSAFDIRRFAQKANSNLSILNLMRQNGVFVDAVSAGEIQRALAAGYCGGFERGEIVFTADVFDDAALALVATHRIPVNVGSIDMLAQLGVRSPGHAVWLRINPGFGHGHSQKTNTGGPLSKHGIWHEALPQALAAVRAAGLRLHGLHMHIGSGVDYGHLQQVCSAMVDLVAKVFEIDREVASDLQALSAGGGLSTPYSAGDTRVDVGHYFSLWHAARQRCQSIAGRTLALEIEPGRFFVAEAGLLLARVRAVKDAGENRFVLVDAGFNELMRPAMYGSYHAMHVQRAGCGVLAEAAPALVAGPLCESGDVFTQGAGGVAVPRALGAAAVGDLLVIHDAGAYGASMSSNYNTRGLAAEVLIERDGQPRLIRRRQSVDELLALEQNLDV